MVNSFVGIGFVLFLIVLFSLNKKLKYKYKIKTVERLGTVVLAGLFSFAICFGAVFLFAVWVNGSNEQAAEIMLYSLPLFMYGGSFLTIYLIKNGKTLRNGLLWLNKKWQSTQ
jgi:hypothetical protein